MTQEAKPRTYPIRCEFRILRPCELGTDLFEERDEVWDKHREIREGEKVALRSFISSLITGRKFLQIPRGQEDKCEAPLERRIRMLDPEDFEYTLYEQIDGPPMEVGAQAVSKISITDAITQAGRGGQRLEAIEPFPCPE